MNLNEIATSAEHSRHYEIERFDHAVRRMFTVPKEDLVNEETKWMGTYTKRREKKARIKGFIAHPCRP
jgi:hypothetical protein